MSSVVMTLLIGGHVKRLRSLLDIILTYHDTYIVDTFVSLFTWFSQTNQSDVEEVKQALNTGKMNGKEHTEEEINALIKSGKFSNRYYKYIRRTTWSAAVLKDKLETWKQKFEHCIDSVSNQKLFVAGVTVPAIVLQSTRVEHIVDPRDVDMFRKVPAPDSSKHMLPTYIALRGEKVEIFHNPQVIDVFFKNGIFLPLVYFHSNFASVTHMHSIAHLNS